MFAAINLYKPKGLTSHDCVARLRRIFNLKKIGHMGTLDPLAEGVLPLCLGQATRLIEYFPTDKRYTATITLGRTTTTLDSEGEVLSETDCRPLEISHQRIQEILPHFTGTIQQQVPLYSAVHVQGKKLYEIARKQERLGQAATMMETLELPTREVTIYQLNIEALNNDDPAHPVLTLDVQCSSGTYIRSLARDIGAMLGCGAYLSGLIRSEHGAFSLKDSVTLETLQEAGQAENDPHVYLLNPVSYLAIPILELPSEESAKRLSQGMQIPCPEYFPPEFSPKDYPLALSYSETGSKDHLKNPPKNHADIYLATHQDKPIGVVEAVEQRLKPMKILNL